MKIRRKENQKNTHRDREKENELQVFFSKKQTTDTDTEQSMLVFLLFFLKQFHFSNWKNNNNEKWSNGERERKTYLDFFHFFLLLSIFYRCNLECLQKLWPSFENFIVTLFIVSFFQFSIVVIDFVIHFCALVFWIFNLILRLFRFFRIFTLTGRKTCCNARDSCTVAEWHLNEPVFAWKLRRNQERNQIQCIRALSIRIPSS